MALSEERLKLKIDNVINECRKDEGNGDVSKSKFSKLLAKAFIEEIKEIEITYTSGLIAPSSGGAVTGTFNATIK